MVHFKSIKILALLIAVMASGSAHAGSVIVGGQKLKSFEEISDYYIQIYSTHMSNAITSRTLSKLELTKLDGRFAFVSPSVQTWRERYVWVGGGLNKPSDDSQSMIAYSGQIQSEMIFYYFEKMGLLDKIDIIDEVGFTKDIENQYDYIVTMRSDFSGKRDAKSVNGRKTEFFVRNVKTGKEQKITEMTGAPVLVYLFESVAVKFTDAVKATN